MANETQQQEVIQPDEDQRRKLIDAFEIQNLLTGLSGTVTRLFSRALSWSPDYVAVIEYLATMILNTPC
ncbi:5f8b4809-5c15-40b6-8716-959a07b474bf [Thermothielavioides terrestris]|uniref:5f8b4809-5c15-40b6-8716-959a07b474bf n=1 Tax=Thermothielavioides terrestris TaxID=2587410 RepID=A0A446BEY1_9PEZI|nr:5f8b4809-5c15-40b6-8716-959a07b474bf [Thermothielavioides terrestris]